VPRLTNEIAILEVETIQLIARLLGIHHVLVDDIGGSFGLIGNALADLAVHMVSIWILRSCGARVEGVLPDGTEFAKQIEQLLWSDVVAISSQYALPAPCHPRLLPRIVSKY